MPVYYRNPMTILASQAGATDPSVKITNYDTSTGQITGINFGIVTGSVYLLNRDTHTYTKLTTSGWNDTGITLTNPIDLSTIEGHTCFFVRTKTGANSNKYLIQGDIAITGWGIVYLQNPQTLAITKLRIATSTEMGVLSGSAPSVSSGYVTSYFYGKSAILEDTAFNTGNIVGVQFGSSTSGYTIPPYFLMGLVKLDQPVVIKSGMTVSSTASYFMYGCRSFNCPLVFTGSTSSQNRFGNYFMGKCVSFNQPLDLTRFVYLSSTYFMSNCWSFNSELKLTANLNSAARGIGANFMERCVSFNQPLTLPSNHTSIGNYFFYCCSAFNQPLEFKLNISGSSIGTYFMAYCYGYNQPIDFSGTYLTSIPAYFLYCAKSFNSPVLFPVSGLTSIGNYFIATTTGTTSTITTNLVYGGSFNQDLDLANVTSIGNYFLANQIGFNSTINIPKVTTIGTYFMQNCNSFAQPITIPSTVTGIGASFMINILTSRKMTVNTGTIPTSGLAQTSTTSAYTPSQIDATCSAVTQGVYLYGTKSSEWVTALPNTSTSPWRTLIDGEA